MRYVLHEIHLKHTFHTADFKVQCYNNTWNVSWSSENINSTLNNITATNTRRLLTAILPLHKLSPQQQPLFKGKSTWTYSCVPKITTYLRTARLSSEVNTSSASQEFTLHCTELEVSCLVHNSSHISIHKTRRVPTNPISLESTLILSSHLSLGLSSRLFRVPTSKPMVHYPPTNTCRALHPHFPLDLMTEITFDYASRRSSLCSFHHFLLLPASYAQISSSAPYSPISLPFPYNVTDQFSYRIKTAGKKVNVLYILIFMFPSIEGEEEKLLWLAIGILSFPFALFLHPCNYDVLM
jgi:hypothetical protein